MPDSTLSCQMASSIFRWLAFRPAFIQASRPDGWQSDWQTGKPSGKTDDIHAVFHSALLTVWPSFKNDSYPTDWPASWNDRWPASLHDGCHAFSR
jgi:hypothetical protein